MLSNFQATAVYSFFLLSSPAMDMQSTIVKCLAIVSCMSINCDDNFCLFQGSSYFAAFP